MIYFISSHKDYIKIGTSIDPESRKSSLQTANPKTLRIQAVLEGSFQTESGLHELFKHIRYKGEWFKLTDELKWFIKAIQTNPDVSNIYTLYHISQKLRLHEKANRLVRKNNNPKLRNKIKEIQAGHRPQRLLSSGNRS